MVAYYSVSVILLETFLAPPVVVVVRPFSTSSESSNGNDSNKGVEKGRTKTGCKHNK